MDLTTKIVSSLDEFRNLQASWAQLIEEADIDSVFLSWEWMFSWWETYHHKLNRTRLFIILLYNGEKPVGIIPLYLECYPLGMNAVRLLGDQVETSLYTDFIYREAHREEIYRSLIMTFRQHRIRFIYLNKVLEEARCRDFMENFTHYTFLREECPYVVLPDNREIYTKGLRKSVMSARRKLFGKLGARKVNLLSDRGCDRSIERLFDLHEKQLSQKQEKTRFLKSERMEFHKKVVTRLAPQNKVFLQGIEHDSEIIAINYGFNQNGWSFGYQMGYDFAYRKYSIGYQTILTGIEDSIDSKQKYYDLSTGASSYKRVFSGEQRSLFNSFISLGGVGDLAVYGYKMYKGLRLQVKQILLKRQEHSLNAKSDSV